MRAFDPEARKKQWTTCSSVPFIMLPLSVAVVVGLLFIATPASQGRSVLRSVTGDLGFPRAEMSESIRDNPNRRLSHAGVAIGDFALDP